MTVRTHDPESPAVRSLVRSLASDNGEDIDLLEVVSNLPGDQTWKHLHDTRKTLRKLHRHVVDGIGDTGDADKMEAAADRLGDMIERITDEIDERHADGVREWSELQIVTPRPSVSTAPQRIDGGGLVLPDSAETWRDTKTGREVRVLGREASVAALYEPHTDGLTLGHCLRAMLTKPANDAERRALAEGTDSAGGFTVPAPLLARFIDKLRAQTVVFRAGARTVPMDSETLSIAKVASDPTTVWHAENAQESDSDPTFTRVQFTAHTLLSIVRASRELIADSANAEAALEAAFAGALGVELDRAALFGAGSGDEPQGVSGASGVNSVSMGTDGGAPSGYGEILSLYQAILEDNASAPNAAIMAPRTLIQYDGLTATDGQPLMRPSLLRDMPFLNTTSVPVDQTQGTSNDASTLLLGDWSRMMVGIRSELRIELLRERYADSYQFGFLAHLRADVQLEHGEAFGELVGITPA